MVTTTESTSLENDVTPLARRLQEFSPGAWESIRDRGIEPAFESARSDDDAIREEFLAGAELLGLVGGRKTLQPQQMRLSEVLGADNERVAVCWPRRSSKTTTILAVLLGRCLLRPGYTVLASAQDQTKTGARFRDWMIQIERVIGDTRKPGNVIHSRSSNGSMHMRFDNGSMFYMLRPVAEAYRGEAADCVWLDESQEHDAETSADLLSGVLPTMDTADGETQLIVSGTAGEARSGMLWDFLELGRAETASYGISEYAAPPTTTAEDLEDEDLWKRTHPGLDGLTKVERIRSNFEAMGGPQFAREYLGLWPVAADVAVIPQHLWEAAALDKKLPYPEQVAFGFDISPNGSTAAIVAAWRVDGVAYLELVAHESGSTWLRDRMVALSTKYKAVVGFDPIGSNRVVQEEVSRSRSAAKGRLRPVERGGISPACVTILRDLEDGKVKHFNQQGLNEAAAFAAKRVWGDGSTWSWGRIASGGDITPLVAATMALRAFDETPATRTLRIITA